MRLGGPTFAEHADPETWLAEVRGLGWRAAFCPLAPGASEEDARRWADAARRADVVIAEVGAWSNPMSPVEAERKAAMAKCIGALALAERVGARCAVNIAGSLGTKWDGPCAADLTEDAFDRVVQCVRAILDAVKPRRTYYTLECMPWMVPDSPDCCLRLLAAVDRPAFGVHLDPVNMVSSPQRYFHNGEFLRECFAKLGPHIRSCHAKDILMSDRFTVHLDEVRPGLGTLDWGTYLRELERLPGDVPLMVEHLPSRQEYVAAAEHIRAEARRANLEL